MQLQVKQHQSILLALDKVIDDLNTYSTVTLLIDVPDLHTNTQSFRNALLKNILRHLLKVPEKELVLKANLHGKPYIETPGDAPIFFNHSNKHHYLLYTFSYKTELGIDIEYINSKIEAEEIASTLFSKEELRFLQNLTENKKYECFYTLWTGKEALAKCAGLTLAATLPFSLLPILRGQKTILFHENRFPIYHWTYQKYRIALASLAKQHLIKMHVLYADSQELQYTQLSSCI